MSVDIHESGDDRIVEVTLSGKLTKKDYREFVPVVETAIKRNGKIRMVVVMRDFHGWSAGALWEDIKFDWNHLRDIERLAIVGDKRWEAGMAVFCKPFTTATIKYFDVDRLAEAKEWVGADLHVAASH
jgi:hypothetical protein